MNSCDLSQEGFSVGKGVTMSLEFVCDDFSLVEGKAVIINTNFKKVMLKNLVATKDCLNQSCMLPEFELDL